MNDGNQGPCRHPAAGPHDAGQGGMIPDMPRQADMEKTSIYARVSNDDLAELDAYAKSEMLTRSLALAKILRAWADQRRAAKGGKPKAK